MSGEKKNAVTQKESVPDVFPIEADPVAAEPEIGLPAPENAVVAEESLLQEAKPDLVLVKFIAPYKNYSPDDVSGFDEKTALMLLSKHYVVEYRKE